MKFNKKSLGLTIALTLALAPILSGCGWLDRLMHPPALDEQQALILTQVVGVPAIEDYYLEALGEDSNTETGFGNATPAPGWSADYQGDGLWLINGPVNTDYWGTCQTTWHLSEKDSKLSLVAFECSQGG